MDKITLAEHLDEMLRQELPEEHEFKHTKNEWFIAMILSLFKQFEDILPNIDLPNSSLVQIIKEIESYFKRKQLKRELEQQLLRSFFYNQGQYRKMEDLILLLLLGYSLLNSFRRLCNAQKDEGQVLELEANEYNVFQRWSYQETLPKQVKSPKVEKLIAMVKDEELPAIAVSTCLKHINTKNTFNR